MESRVKYPSQRMVSVLWAASGWSAEHTPESSGKNDSRVVLPLARRHLRKVPPWNIFFLKVRGGGEGEREGREREGGICMEKM